MLKELSLNPHVRCLRRMGCVLELENAADWPTFLERCERHKEVDREALMAFKLELLRFYQISWPELSYMEPVDELSVEWFKTVLTSVLCPGNLDC